MSRTVAVLALLVLLGCATVHARQEPLGGAIEAREGRALKTWLWGGHWVGHPFWWWGGVRYFDEDWCKHRRMKCWDKHDDECDCHDRRRVHKRRWSC